MSPIRTNAGRILGLLSLALALVLAMGLPRLEVVGEMWRLIPETPENRGTAELLTRFGADPPVFGWVATDDGSPAPDAIVAAMARADASLQANPLVHGLTAGIDPNTALDASTAPRTAGA